MTYFINANCLHRSCRQLAVFPPPVSARRKACRPFIRRKAARVKESSMLLVTHSRTRQSHSNRYLGAHTGVFQSYPRLQNQQCFKMPSYEYLPRYLCTSKNSLPIVPSGFVTFIKAAIRHVKHGACLNQREIARITSGSILDKCYHGSKIIPRHDNHLSRRPRLLDGSYDFLHRPGPSYNIRNIVGLIHDTKDDPALVCVMCC